ncbi:MAG: elongation factor G [Deltaproteobacteria bacterium]|nr:elongation factor G [Deltaproteobacteria bacterium]
MQVDNSAQIRNLALVGHNDTGKTTLASALLYTGGAINRMTKVEDGNTITDFDPEETARGISIGLAPCFVPWNKHKINLIDSPGYGIFFTEARAAMRAADTSLLCVSGVSGVEVMTERAWKYAGQLDQPVVFHLTRMDRERADLARSLESLQDLAGRGVLPIQIPIGKEGDFKGVVDVVEQKAYLFDLDGDGKGKEEEVPAELADACEEARNNLMEAVAETDDLLLESYFDEGTLSQTDFRKGLRRAILKRKIFPVTMSASLHGIGSSALLNTLVSFAPTPLDRETFPATNLGGEEIDIPTTAEEPASALVFKTLSDPFTGRLSIFRVVSGEVSADTMLWNAQSETSEKMANLVLLQGKQPTQVSKLVTGDIGTVAKLKKTATGNTLCAKDKPVNLSWIPIREAAMSFAIEPKSKGDEEKIGEALQRLIEEDVRLQAGRDTETGEYLLSGTGQLHIEIAVAKLKSRYKVEVILHPPKIPYRETIRKTSNGHGRHKKQTGGRGQFADCKIMMEPLARGEEFEFADKIFGGAIPQGYRPAVEKGIQETRRRGFLAGYPVVDFRVSLLDGQYHDVDSSEMAFKVAGSLAFKDAMAKAAPVIIEPLMELEITTTEEFMGDIMGDLSQRRGRPQGMEVKGDNQVIKAVAPMAEMLDYARALRAMTQGRSRFHMEFSHYEEVPRNIQDKLIAEAEQAKGDPAG